VRSGMSQLLRDVFAGCKKAGRPAFVGFLTAGYPTLPETVPLLLAMEKGGADVIEVGVPFSDPMADGATIQVANHVAVENKVSFGDCVSVVRQARAKGLKAPVIFMGYVNSLIKYGEEKAVKDAKDAGANGFIVVDLPIEEEPNFFQACRTHSMSFVPLVAPTTREGRLPLLCGVADSFIYCVSVTGVTGQRKDLPEELPAFIQNVRKHTSLPIAVGFGISTREHYKQVSALADGVVVGSAIIKSVQEAPAGKREETVAAFISNLSSRA